MKVLITGASGQLGYDIIEELRSRGIDYIGTDIQDLDLESEEMVTEYITEMSPSVVIHCAAYTAVDDAQDNQKQCELVNAHGSENIAKVCSKINAKLLYVSTDYVFDGSGTEAFETNAKTNPLNVYGKSKLDGEIAVQEYCKRSFVLRTSWVFGKNGTNFVKTIMRLSNERDELKVVDDQVGSPTYTKDLAVLICDMISTDKFGVYHATNEGYCSFAEFAREIIKLCDNDTKVIGVTTEEYGAKAPRPKNSRLSKKSLDDAGFSRLPTWQDALSRFMIEMKQDILVTK